ncbi:MAG: DUF4270 family protein [Mangrovibacterium sp.]
MEKINPLLVLITGVLLFSCNSRGDFNIGEDLVDTQSGITIVDTFQVRLSSLKLDSVVTSGTEQLLCGRYSNAVTGSSELMAYFNFDVGSELRTITEDDRFDSVTLELGYSGYYLGDTLQVQKYSVYRLTQYLDFVDDERLGDHLYNNSSFPHEQNPLGSVQFYPEVAGADSVEFRLVDALGQELISMVLNDATELTANEEFNEYLRGFVLKSDPDSKSILGFKGDTSGVKLNIYTHLVGPGEPVKKRYTINLNQEIKTYFNQTISDRTNTAFGGLGVQEEEVPARYTGHRSFIEGSAGVVARFDFPYLSDMFLFDDRVMIKAQLVFYPAVENDIRFLPQSLVFFESDKHNNLVKSLTTSSGSQSVAVQAQLRKEDPTKELYQDIYNLYYAVDITEYLTGKFAGNYYNPQNGLIVTIPYSDIQSRADLLILNGEDVDLNRYRPKLQLYFLKYE